MEKPPDDSDANHPAVIIAGWAGAGNIGDELLARWTISELRGHGLRPVLLSSDPSASTQLHGVESVDGRSLRAVRRAIRRSDGLVFGPGGIVQDSSSMWSLPFHLWRPFEASRSGIPWVGVGLGVEPLRRRSSRLMGKRTLRHAAAVTVRDRESAEVLAALGLRAGVADDVVFGLASDTTSRGETAVVSLGPEIDRSAGSWHTAGARLGVANVAPIAAALDQVSVEHGLKVAFTAFRGERDREFALTVIDAMVEPAELVVADVDSAPALVGSAAVVVTSRYHPAVLALTAGTPTVLWARSAKLESLRSRFPERLVVASPDMWAASVEEATRRSDGGWLDFNVSAHVEAIATLARRIRAGS